VIAPRLQRTPSQYLALRTRGRLRLPHAIDVDRANLLS